MNQKIFIERKPQKKKLRLRKGVILFVLVFIIVLSAIFLLYFFSEKNRVKSVKVLGNEILSDDYIIENCGINKQDYLLFVNGFTVNKIDLIDNIKVTKNNELLPEFLFTLLNRNSFNAYSRYNSWGSARETFDWSEMCRVQIPLPPIQIQQKIVDLYNCYEECKRIANEAREKISNLCPALVQKATHTY